MAVVNEARAILTAEDRASAVLAMVSRNFDRLNRAADRINTTTGNPRAQQQMQQSLVRTTALTSGLGAAAMRAAGPLAGVFTLYGAGAALSSANKAFSQNERAMTRIAVTADASLSAQQASWQQLQQLAQDTAQPVDKVREGLDALVASGRTLPEAMAFLPAVARTAQASGSEVADIAKTADSVGESFKLAGADMQTAFDIMAAGGKAGKFELKDLARYLPSLGPAASAIGFEGKKGLADLVAMLQVMRKGSGTAEEAVGSMNNILAKMESDKTAKEFKKLGVDSEAAFKKARTEGRNLVEVFEELVNTALKGDRSRLGEIIDDMEFKRGAQALMMYRGEWQKLSQTMQASSAGTVATDLARVTANSQATFDRFQNSASRLADIVGKKLAPAFKGLADSAGEAMDKVAGALEPKKTDKELAAEAGFPERLTPAEESARRAARMNEVMRQVEDRNSGLYQMRDGGFAARRRETKAAETTDSMRAEAGKVTAKKLDDRSWDVDTRVSSHLWALSQHRQARAQHADETGLTDYRQRQSNRARFLQQEREFNQTPEGRGDRSSPLYKGIDADRREKLRVDLAQDQVTAGSALAGGGEAGRALQAAVINAAEELRRRSIAGRDQKPGDFDHLRPPQANYGPRDASPELMLKRAVEPYLQQSGAPSGPAEVRALVQQLLPLIKSLADKPPVPGADPKAVPGLGDVLKGSLEGVKAEVKPDQITAKTDLNVQSTVKVEVAPSPNFIATVKAEVMASQKSMGGVSLPGKEGGGSQSSAASRF